MSCSSRVKCSIVASWQMLLPSSRVTRCVPQQIAASAEVRHAPQPRPPLLMFGRNKDKIAGQPTLGKLNQNGTVAMSTGRRKKIVSKRSRRTPETEWLSRSGYCWVCGDGRNQLVLLGEFGLRTRCNQQFRSTTSRCGSFRPSELGLWPRSPDRHGSESGHDSGYAEND